MSFWILVVLVSNLAEVSAECDSATVAADVGCAARKGRSLVQTKRGEVPRFRMASDNGKKFECEKTLLSTQMCFFVATAYNDIGGAKRHDIDPCNDGRFRKVVNSSGNELAVTPKPWQTGDTLVESESEVTGDLLNYAKAFEMMAPLRDLMMYEPDKCDKELWDFFTKPLKDCGIKENDEEGDHGTAFSRDNIYDILKDNNGKDSHHFILQFLEEGVIDLVCAMTSADSLSGFSRCPSVGRPSNCWEKAYVEFQSNMCGDTSPEPAPEPTPEPTVPEPMPETSRSAPEPVPETTRSAPAPAPPAEPEPPAPKPTRRPRPARPWPKRRR